MNDKLNTWIYMHLDLVMFAVLILVAASMGIFAYMVYGVIK